MGSDSPASFIVVPRTMGRCGSTWFCDMLDAHPRISCLDEVFNSERSDEFADVVDAWQDGGNPGRVFEVVARRSRKARKASRVGFKTFREHVGDDNLRRLIEVTDVLILIDRRNLTAALISELHARKTKLWHARSRRRARSRRNAPPFRVDIAAGRSRLNNARRTGEVVSGMARDVGLPIVEVVYEDLVADTAAEMGRTFHELGVEPRKVSSRFRKLHRDLSFVENLDEVDRELGPEFGRLA